MLAVERAAIEAFAAGVKFALESIAEGKAVGGGAGHVDRGAEAVGEMRPSGEPVDVVQEAARSWLARREYMKLYMRGYRARRRALRKNENERDG